MQRVTVVEVGPRDGLQNEQARVSTADKIEFVNRLSRRASAGDRGRRLRQPEVGAADGGRRRGVRRHHARRRASRYTALVPNLAGLERAHRRRRHRGRDLRLVDRNLQPQEHQPEHRRVAGRPTRRCASARIAAGLRVRGYLSTAFGCPFEGAVAPAAGRRASPRGSPISASSRWRSATRSASRIRARCRGCSRRCSRACRPIASRCTFTTRAAPRSPTCSPSLPFGDRDLRRVGRRPRRLPVRAGRRRQPGHRRSDLHAGRVGDRNGSVAGGGERGVGVHRLENRSPPAVALRAGEFVQLTEVVATSDVLRRGSLVRSSARLPTASC